MLVRTLVPWVLFPWLVVLAGCEELREIGSQCHNGLCEVDPVPNGPACLVSTRSGRLIPNLEEGELPCGQPRHPRDADGVVACDVYWRAADPRAVPPILEQCSGFLSPGAPTLDGTPACRVAQVAVSEGGALEAGAEGFYYLDRVPHDSAVCNDGMRPGGFRYTAGIQVPDGVRHDVECTTTQTSLPDRDLTSIDPAQCARLEAPVAPGIIGASCSPALQPEAGFDQSSASIETANRDCGPAACMVFHVYGALSGDCVDVLTVSDPTPACARDEDHVYCSCRCDVQPGEANPECSCPDDFSCTPVISHGAFAGSYCVRSDQLVTL
jgi:hypothetical protein